MPMKESVEMDTNFYYFIMTLAMMLLAAIIGARINDMKYHQGSLLEIIWMIIFILLMKGLLTFSIFTPYAFYRVGFFAIGLAILHMIMMSIIFAISRISFIDRGIFIVVAELIAILLIMTVGILFLQKGVKRDRIKNEYHREKENLV